MAGSVLATLFALACSGAPADRSVPRDDFGDPLPAAGALPARIVSLSPATTEILFALGDGAALVGRTHWDLYPPAARAVPDLGNGVGPSLEALLAAHPDLVVLYAAADNRATAAALRSRGVPVVALRADRLADFRRIVTVLGALTGRDSAARTLIDTVSRTLDRVRNATAGLPHPTVFLHSWDNPLLTIGGGSYLSELVAIAGGVNVFGDLPAPSPQVSFEEVLRRHPDVILSGPDAATTLRSSPRWRQLDAVRAGRILVLDTILTARPGPRLGEAAESLARLLHPGVLP